MGPGSVDTTTHFAVRESDETQCRMLGGGQQLTLEREQPTSNDVGFAGIEMPRKAVEALALVPHEIDLNGNRFSSSSFGHDNTS